MGSSIALRSHFAPENDRSRNSASSAASVPSTRVNTFLHGRCVFLSVYILRSQVHLLPPDTPAAFTRRPHIGFVLSRSPFPRFLLTHLGNFIEPYIYPVYTMSKRNALHCSSLGQKKIVDWRLKESLPAKLRLLEKA